MKQAFILLFISVVFATSSQAQTARVKVVHNSADAAAEFVDVWINNTLLLEDFEFRTSSDFIDAPAGVNIEIRIKDSGSIDTANPIALNNYNLMAGETYLLVASGIISGTGYMPSTPFAIDVFAMGRESAGTIGNTDVLVYHGSTDAPTVDVLETKTLNAQAADNLGYGQFAGYLELPTNDYRFRVLDSAQSQTVAEFEAPLATLGLDDAALMVVASGFFDPLANSNGAPFGLFAVMADGGDFVPLPNSQANLQVIHNAADSTADTVDIYINGELVGNDVGFRSATGFFNVPSAVDLTVTIAGKDAPGPMNPVFEKVLSVEAENDYIVVANGIVATSGFDPLTPFDLYVSVARDAASQGTNTELIVFHGATDAPVIDVFEASSLMITAADNIGYGQFSGYVEVPTSNYALQVRDAAGTTVLAQYSAPLANLGLQGNAITIVASGFLDPSVNSNGPAFGLWAATANGGDLIELLVTTGVSSVDLSDINIFPNPTTDFINITNLQGSSSIVLMDVSGKIVTQHTSVNGHDQIDVSELADGLYILRIDSEGATLKQKVMIH